MALLGGGGGEGCWREEEDMAGSPSVMKAWAALLDFGSWVMLIRVSFAEVNSTKIRIHSFRIHSF